MNKKNHVNKNRDLWTSKWGFILSCIGSAVGMGNIWLFPSRIAAYGGAFLAAYLFFDVVIGFSGVIGEMSFGRKARSGPIGAFGAACASRGEDKRRLGSAIGSVPMLGSLAMAIGYSVVMQSSAASGRIHHRRRPCPTVLTSTTSPAMKPPSEATASAFGNNSWLLVALVCTFLVMALGVAAGIEKANKIMIPLFYVLFISLVVYVAMLPGSDAGYAHIFTIQTEYFKDPMLWAYALGQSFFSLSLAGNGTIIYGSYLSDEEDIVSSAWKVALFDTLAAFLAALVIVPAMAASGIRDFSGGPGLMFIYLPNLFASMPGSRIIAVIFFLAVLFAGFTSLVNLFEAPVATLQDHLKFSRPKAVAVIAAIGTVTALCIQGIVSQWMDFVSIYVCPLGAGLAGIMFAWVWGKKAVEEAVSLGRKRPVGKWFYPLYKYGFCILTMVVLVAGAVFGGIG